MHRDSLQCPEAIMGWFHVFQQSRTYLQYPFRCGVVRSNCKECDNVRVHLGFYECNYVSFLNASRSVWSSKYDAFTVKQDVSVY